MSATLKHIYPPAPATERGKPASIGGDPKDKKRLIYSVGRFVVIRDSSNPLDTWVYSEHKYDVTCARFAPSGYYIASADKSARVLIWDCVGSDKVIKLDKQSIGVISDIAWTEDSKRVAVCGTGREKMAECFLFDSGASVGEITGHSQPITTIDIKQSRPYRLATGSEDFKFNWFEGPPFKFKQSVKEHSRYVNSVRFSPDGSKLITVGSDKKGFVYEGKEGKKIGELSAEGGHGGSIFSVSWSADSKRVATASGDKTVKIWDAESGKLLSTTNFGDDVQNQQVAVLWQGNQIFSVSLQGAISVINESNPTEIASVQHGHNKVITAISYNSATDKFYTTDPSQYLLEWDAESGRTAEFVGKPHGGSISALKVHENKLITVASDDTIRFNNLDKREYTEGISLGSQPSGVDASKNITVVSSYEGVVVFQDEKLLLKFPVKYEPATIAISPDATEVSVSSKINNNIYVYHLDGGKLTEKHIIEGHRGPVSALAYSPDGRYLGAGDAYREVKVWEGIKEISIEWIYHTARVQSLTWSSDSTKLVTGSVDSAIAVWDVTNPKFKIYQKLAHPGGVRGAFFRKNTTQVISAGDDCSAKLWHFSY